MRNNGKKLAFWGAGSIANMCLEAYPDKLPDFFIDSSYSSDSFRGRKVYSPKDIKEWNTVYIVVTIASYWVIEEELCKLGLVKGNDFVTYKDYFHIAQFNLTESIISLDRFVHEGQNLEGATIIFAPFNTGRRKSIWNNFLKEYASCHTEQKFLGLTRQGVQKATESADDNDIPIFVLPQICNWNGMKSSYSLSSEDKAKISELTDEDKKWIRILGDIYVKDDPIYAMQVLEVLYWYIAKIFEVMKPQKILMWGGVSRLEHIMVHIAKKEHIAYRFIEGGWLPGTIQIDRLGVGGRGEFANNPKQFLGEDTKTPQKEIDLIKKYIIDTKLDSGNFKVTEADEKMLSKIHPNQKTLFFIGMGWGDYDRNKDFWKQNYTPVYDSNLDILKDLYPLCQKYGWNLIYKPHPGFGSEYREQQVKYEELIYVEDAEIDQLIERSDLMLTVSSQVDYKVLVYGKPLIQLGKSPLTGVGCTYEIKQKKELEDTIQLAIIEGFTNKQKERFDLHLKHLLEYSLWDDLSERAIRYGLPITKDFFEE